MSRNLLLGALLPLAFFALTPAKAQLKIGVTGSANAEHVSGVKSGGDNSSGSSSHSAPENSSYQSAAATYTPPPQPEPEPEPTYSTPSSAAASYSSDYSSSSTKGTSSSDDSPSESYSTYSASPSSASSGGSSGGGGGGREITGATPVEISPVVSPPSIDLSDLQHAVADLSVKVDDPSTGPTQLQDLYTQSQLLTAMLERMDHRGRNWRQLNLMCVQINLQIENRLTVYATRDRLALSLHRKALLVPLLMPNVPGPNAPALAEVFTDSVLGLPEGGWEYYQNMQYFDPLATQGLMRLVENEAPYLVESEDYFILSEFFAHFHESLWDSEVRHFLSRNLDTMDQLETNDPVLCEAVARNTNLVAHTMLKMVPGDTYFSQTADYTYAKLSTLKAKPTH
jgi:hypothetical protein